ncbi:MAG: outer membrane beta-barrel protein [Bacteroidota bacterium]|nr:outer membrane beta-barrel protein [Bacteroidota bacterium]
MKTYLSTQKYTAVKSFIVFFLITAFSINSGTAQNNVQGKIEGTLKDASGKPLEFVNVMLLSSTDSALVKGAASDAHGKYIIENVAEGKYVIAASQVGFEKAFSDIFSINQNQTIVKMPVLTLKEDVKLLSEITVETTKPFIEQEIDKMVINVENSIVSSGNNALEVLEKAPGVTIDRQNEQIQLKGKQGVIVLINGKQTYLSGQDLTNLLKSTSSESIEKIEIITNPSSKYDAAGNSGIINIKMKKNNNFGTNGSATVGAGYGRFGKKNASIMLNHRAGKINTFGNYSYFNGKSFQSNEISRVIPYDGTVTYFDQESYRPNQFIGNNFRGGIDYFASSKSTFGFLVTGFANNWEQFDAENRSVLRNESGDKILKPITNVAIDDKRSNITGNLNYKYDFNDKGQELTVDLDYSRYDGNSFNNLVTEYYDAQNNTAQPAEEIRNFMPSNINIWAIKSDYTLPLEGGAKLEAGIKSSYINSDNDLIFENYIENGWYLDESKSNHFKYEENINAAYANYGGKINDKTTYQMGLRLEQTYSKGHSITLNETVERNYINLFPTLFLSRNIDSSNVVNLSYSRRIDRPNYQDLNPFVFYLDPYTYQKGNPFLQPQLTHSMQLTHMFKNKLNTTLGYSRTTDVIMGEVPGQIPEENITFVTTENLASQDNINLTISYPLKVANWWNIQNNLNVFYNQYNSTYLDGPFNMEIVAWNAYIANNFILGKGFTAELAGWYNSKNIYGFFVSEPMGAFSVGLQKTMFDKKLTVKVNVNDPLFLNRFRGSANYQDIKLDVLSRWESRVARLSLTYNFGNQNVKGARQRSTGTEAERNRAGGGQ